MANGRQKTVLEVKQIEVTPSLYSKFKASAAADGLTLRDAFRQAMLMWLGRNRSLKF